MMASTRRGVGASRSLNNTVSLPRTRPIRETRWLLGCQSRPCETTCARLASFTPTCYLEPIVKRMLDRSAAQATQGNTPKKWPRLASSTADTEFSAPPVSNCLVDAFGHSLCFAKTFVFTGRRYVVVARNGSTGELGCHPTVLPLGITSFSLMHCTLRRCCGPQ